MTPTRRTNPPANNHTKQTTQQGSPTKLAPTMRPTDEPHSQPYKSHPPPTRPTTTADPPGSRQPKWHQLSSTLLSSQGTDTHHPDPHQPAGTHPGQLLHLTASPRRVQLASCASLPVREPGSATDHSRSRLESVAGPRSGQRADSSLALPSQGFRPRDQPFRAVSPRGSHLRSPHPVRSSRPGDEKNTTRRSARGANRHRHRPRGVGIPTRTAGQRARVTTARAFFPRRSSTCFPCRKSPSSSTWSSEVAFALLT